MRHGLPLYLPPITYSYIGINTDYVALHDQQHNPREPIDEAQYCNPFHPSPLESMDADTPDGTTLPSPDRPPNAAAVIIDGVHKANDQSNTIRFKTSTFDNQSNTIRFKTSTFELEACRPRFVIVLRLRPTIDPTQYNLTINRVKQSCSAQRFNPPQYDSTINCIKQYNESITILIKNQHKTINPTQ